MSGDAEGKRLEVSKSREVGKVRVGCKSVKSVIITVSAQKATSQLAEMVLIILTQSAPRHPAPVCVCVCLCCIAQPVCV